MDEFTEPEILKSPLDQTILQLKSIGAKDLLQFPFVTMPPLKALIAALRHLTILGALEVEDRDSLDSLLEFKLVRDNTSVTELGTLLSKIPLSPRFSKMMVLAAKYSVLRYVVMIVACLSVQELFLDIPMSNPQMPDPAEEEEEDLLRTQFDRDKDQRKLIRAQKEAAANRTRALREQRQQWQMPESDCLLYCNLLEDYFNHVQSSNSKDYAQTEKAISDFCKQHSLQVKAVKEVHYLCI